MTLTQEIITIAAAVLGTMATRFLPFLLFPAHKQTPPVIKFLGQVLPPAVMGMLAVYSLKDVQLFSGSHGLPEALAIILIIILQYAFKNALLTIGASTIFYMYLVQQVFM